MSAINDRRNFMKKASMLPLAAAFGAGLTPNLIRASEPIARIGGSHLKSSLNAFSFGRQLNNYAKKRGSGMSLFDLLDFCAKHNFDGIDPTGYYFPNYPDAPPDSFINEFKRRAHNLGLGISGTGSRNDFATTDKVKRAKDVAHVKQWIEVAAKMGAPVLRVFAGRVPEGYEDRWDEVAEWMAEALKECADYAAKYGVIIGVQNHGDMLKTAEETIKIVKMVDSKWFGVIVDTGYFMTEDPYKDIAAVLPYAVNWQVKESPFGKESSIRIDMPKLIKIARDGGYRGYMPIETLSVPNRPYDPFKLVPEFLAEFRAAL